MGEIESQTIGRDERARLVDVLAQHLPQSRVKKVRRSVIALGISATIAWDDRSRVSELDLARDLADRGDAAFYSADFVDVDAPSFAQNLPTVGDLPARLDVERCLAKDYGGASVWEITLGDHVGFDVERVVAGE
jgi:hypothetical protein